MRPKFARRNGPEPKGTVNCSERQTVAERIKYLRANQKPYLTQRQLAERSGLSFDTIWRIENEHTKGLNTKLKTIIRIAHALDCKVFINIKSRPSNSATECLPLDHKLPVLPKRTGKSTELTRRLALLNGRSYGKKYRRRSRHEQYKEISEKQDLEISSEKNPFE